MGGKMTWAIYTQYTAASRAFEAIIALFALFWAAWVAALIGQGLTFNPRLTAGVFNVDVTAHNAGNVTIGARTVRAKITPQAMIQTGVDIAWPVV